MGRFLTKPNPTSYESAQYDPKYDDAKPSLNSIFKHLRATNPTDEYYHFIAIWDKYMYNGENPLK